MNKQKHSYGAIMSVTLASVELTLTGVPGGWVVSVMDNEGPLHVTMFDMPEATIQQALEWFDHCRDAIDNYLESPTSLTATKFTETLLTH